MFPKAYLLCMIHPLTIKRSFETPHTLKTTLFMHECSPIFHVFNVIIMTKTLPNTVA